MRLCGLFFVLSMAAVRLWAVEDYFPRVDASIEDRWRWTELEGLSGLDIRCAAEGRNGEIWFARKRGAVRYDGRSLDFFDLPEDQISAVKDIHVSREGVVYLFSDRFILALKEGEWMVLSSALTDSAFVNAICEAENGDIWIGRNREIIRFRESEMTSFDAGFAQVGSVIIDSNGKLWVADVETNRIAVFDPEKADEGALPRLHVFNCGGSISFPTKLFLDTQGKVWAINPDDADRCVRFENYQRQWAVEGLRRHGFASVPLSIAETPPGRMWFAVGRRLGEVVDGKMKVYEVENHPLPTSYPYILALSGDRLLIGGRVSKIYIVDLSNDHWTRYRDLNFQREDSSGAYWFLHHDGRVVWHSPESQEWLAYSVEDGTISEPNRVFASRDGVVWVSGMHQGDAAVSYLENGSWQRLAFPDAGRIFSHLSVIETSDGSVMFGAGTPPTALGNRRGGAVVFRKENGVYQGSHVAPPIFPNRTANIVERRNDGFWFGAASLTRRLSDGGLAPERIELFEDHWIDHMIVDQENHLWVALWGSGVYRFNGDEWFLYNEASGLGSDQVVYLLNGRKLAGVWAATGKGLSRFDGRSWSDWDLPSGSAFQRENNTLGESGDGSLWLNYAYRSWLLEGRIDDSHRNLYRTIRYKPDDAPPETSILEFETDVPEGSQAAFAWRGKDAWSNTPSNEIEYSWRLDGGEWSPFSRDQSVIVERLAGGERRIEVRARDRDWNIDPTPALASLQVVLPLWKRTWFICLVVAAVGLIAYLVNALFKARVRTAIAMEEFKLDFFTSISHELRNPLAVIVGPLESLLSKEQSSERRSVLQIALRNARKMQGLIDQLLQFRKLELGKALYRPSRGEIVGFIKDAIEADAPLWQAKGHSVKVEADPSYCECDYDADKLQKILDNLLSNAIKYTPGGGTIKVKVSISTADAQMGCELVVEDNGVGIPQHQIDLVSKPFYRVNGSGEGFGIGLALVGQLIQLWGGEFVIESPIQKNGKGTRATVRLPLIDAAEGETAEVVEIDSEPFGDYGDEEEGSRSKLLLVEDNADLRLFMKNELAERFEILEAGDGREGLEMAIRANPHLVITDVMMPEMDGFELCRKMRADSETSHIPIIMLTAKSSEEHSVEGIEAGADAYFPKPLNMLRLLARVEHLLETRKRLKQRFSEQLVIEPTDLTVTSTDEAILRKALKVVEDNMNDETFSVEHFAKEMAMSRATLYRKLKALTGQAPNPFIRSMRLKRAAQMLKTGKVTVSETLVHVGILDLSYFSRIFKNEFGVPPSDYVSERQDA